jgi:hypothetical protein
MRTKFRTIIPILIAVITAISVIPAYAEVIPRESLPENTPQAAVDTAEVLIGATLAKVEYGMGYADARAETNRIIFEAFLSNQTNGYSYGLLTIIANNAIYEYRDMYLRPEYYRNAEEIVKIMITDLIASVENGTMTYDDAKKQAYIRIYQSVNPAFNPEDCYMTDFCYWDIPAADSAYFNRARKLLLNAEEQYRNSVCRI